MKVLFVQSHVKHYRVCFFEQLHERLKREGIEMRLVYGNPVARHSTRNDNVDFLPAYARKVKVHWLGGRVAYHPILRDVAWADLIIIPNEHRFMILPLLLGLSVLRIRRVAFWGKGSMLPCSIWHVNDWLRYRTRNAVDWWFTYTEAMADRLKANGTRPGITAVHNTIDTSEICDCIASLTAGEVQQAKERFGLREGPVGIYCGNLGKNKHLDFLIASARLIRQSIPSFQLLIVGGGEEYGYVEQVAAHEPWVVCMGPKHGKEKALALACADVFLLPGSVGLAILDSFAAGVPLLTTELHTHGPEIDYLVPGRNGMITAHHPRAYAAAVTGLLMNAPMLRELRAGATASGQSCTMQTMVEKFVEGIQQCMGQPRPEAV